MEALDKTGMGKRIRQIRLQAGLRQWEVARMLGTTQSAVHKYEHGVVPEPRRLMELARVGNSSIEWILSGRHWENGSEDRERVPADLLRTAELLREIEVAQRPSLDEALRILKEAIGSLTPAPESDASTRPDLVAAELQNHSRETLRLLEAAWRIHTAVLRRVSLDASARLDASALSEQGPASAPGAGSERPSATRR